MKHFKKPDGSIWAFESDGSQDKYITADMTPITDAELAALRAPTLAQAQATQIGEMYTAYQAAIAINVNFTTAAGVAKAFQSDPKSVANAQAMLAAYKTAVPAGFYWVSADNTQVPFTLADLQGLAKTMGDQGWQAFQRLQVAKGAVSGATTVTAVQAVTF